MKRAATLPLGIDIGTARTRVALLERTSAGSARLVACATRATGDDPTAAIADGLAELGTRERRCVLGLAPPDALLRIATFPAMRRAERERAARFDAARIVTFPIAEATVRVTPLDDGRCVVGIARRGAIAARISAALRARLRPVAVDDAALALLRAFPDAGAIVDAGEVATRLVVPGDPIPSARTFAVGGGAFTAAVASSLGVDRTLAEHRKRSLGLAGAGEQVRDDLVEGLAAALIEARAGDAADVRSIALVGNASRLTGLAAALERAVAIPVRLGSLPESAEHALPPDVVRAASPDWGLAYGLALWEGDGV